MWQAMKVKQDLTSGPYGSLEMSSGAIQYGVPTKDFLRWTSFETWAQKPKSDSFIWRCSKNRKKYLLKIIWHPTKLHSAK